MPEHKHFHRVGTVSARHQDHQLQRLAEDQVVVLLVYLFLMHNISTNIPVLPR